MIQLFKNYGCMLLLVTSLSYHANSQSLNKTIVADNNTTYYKGKVHDLAWLVGNWKGKGLGGDCQENWSAPAGGSMMGMFKMMVDGEVQFYEFITLIEVGEHIEMRLKHFTPEMKSWEEKEKFIVFKLIKMNGHKAYFNGLTIDKIDAENMQIHLLFYQDDGSKKEETFVFTQSD